MNNSNGYYILGFFAALLSTPLFIYLITLNASDFEGAKGLAQVYLLPFVFVFLLIAWFVVHAAFKTKPKYYLITKVVFILLSVIPLTIFVGSELKDQQNRIEKKRNSTSCQKQLKEVYNGIVIVARSNYIQIRKLDDDGLYEEFNYHFKVKYDVNKDFYIGQKIFKKENGVKFHIISRNGKTKEFTIPCYQ